MDHLVSELYYLLNECLFQFVYNYDFNFIPVNKLTNDLFCLQNQTLAWAAYGNSYEKIGFLKAFFNCLGEEELGHIKKLLIVPNRRKLPKQDHGQDQAFKK